nr:MULTISPECIES: SGNH/GDSL hydrolase family protein [unclassified Sphingomonas]
MTCVLICAALVAVVVIYYQARRTPVGRPEYVALGSSFAAGAGLGPLQSGSPLLCARSINGYPQQLAALRHQAIVDMSCGGAVTSHVLRGGQFFQRAQISAIKPQTQLVTITVGGNDIGYIGDLSQLAARHTHTLFGRLVALSWKGPRTDRGYETLERNLLASLRAIRAKAPQATIVVATYPAIVPRVGTCTRLGLTAAEAASMRSVGDELAVVTKSIAKRGGAILVDMNALGATHDACSAVPWTRGWTNGGIAPFHPTLAGAVATAQAIAAAIAPQAVQAARTVSAAPRS